MAVRILLVATMVAAALVAAAAADLPGDASSGTVGAGQRVQEEQRTGRTLLADMADSALVEERHYFDSLDRNKDGVLDGAEFHVHLKDAARLPLPSEDEDDEAAPDGTLGKTVGRMWIDLHGEDADKEAFAGIDQDSDSKIGWDEWVKELFHDQPQQPFYVDGELGEVMTEEQFASFDKNKDGVLNIEEIRGFVGKFMAREEVDPEFSGLEPEHDTSGKAGSTGLSYLFLIDFDTDGDSKVSLAEWNVGFKGGGAKSDHRRRGVMH